jgi:hypothetical protein
MQNEPQFNQIQLESTEPARALDPPDNGIPEQRKSLSFVQTKLGWRPNLIFNDFTLFRSNARVFI